MKSVSHCARMRNHQRALPQPLHRVHQVRLPGLRGRSGPPGGRRRGLSRPALADLFSCHWRAVEGYYPVCFEQNGQHKAPFIRSNSTISHPGVSASRWPPTLSYLLPGYLPSCQVWTSPQTLPGLGQPSLSLARRSVLSRGSHSSRALMNSLTFTEASAMSRSLSVLSAARKCPTLAGPTERMLWNFSAIVSRPTCP